MEPLLEPIKYPLNFWNKDYISPGAVGSVGDTMPRVRLRQSAVDMPARYAMSGRETEKYGSNVQDGYKTSFTTGGLGAKSIERPFGYRQGFKTDVGWIHQDIVAADRSRIPRLASQPQFSWKSQVAGIERSKDTYRFDPLPGGYGPSGLVRGGSAPRVTARTGENDRGDSDPFQEYVLPDQATTSLMSNLQQGAGLQPRTSVRSQIEQNIARRGLGPRQLG